MFAIASVVPFKTRFYYSWMWFGEKMTILGPLLESKSVIARTPIVDFQSVSSDSLLQPNKLLYVILPLPLQALS